jgi:flagellar biosynthesis GTPase FlhF
VLSASTGLSSNLETLRAFSPLQPAAVAVTKFDEATRPGEVVNVLVRSHVPLAVTTSGPRVPDDLELASRTTLPRLLLDPNAV